MPYSYVESHCILVTPDVISDEYDSDRSQLNQESNDECTKSLVGFIVLKKSHVSKEKQAVEELIQKLKCYLSEPLVPRLVVMDDLPLLSCGKINRQALQEKYSSESRLRENSRVIFLTVSTNFTLN